GCIALGVYILFLYDRSVAAERMPAKGGFSLVCSGSSDGVQSYCAEQGEVSRKKVENNHADL
ncbi:MAG: hypothetical protein IKZ19_02305, partial [Clostridia bacterium]|nr:hypothetical protein [Clostridia bacterium]